MKDLGITKGEWLIDGDFIFSDEFDIAGVIVGDMPKDQVKSNTKLIADAGTTANKCGLLPSELLAQRDELISVINSFIRDFEGDYVMRDGSIVDNPSNILLTNYKLLKNTINKVTE